MDGSVSPQFVKSSRTTALRDKDRVSYERATAYAILDEAYHCHLGFTVPAEFGDGEPRILPTLHVRLGDTLYVHGSTGSRPLLAAREAGLPVCVTVTQLDGLVLARSQFNHSANYRSVVAHGRARLVTAEAEKLDVLTALVEKLGPGRAADTRPPTRRELAETAVLALPLEEVSVKARLGGVIDDPEDLDLPYWAGVVPLRLTPGRPEPATGVRVPVPDYLSPDRGPWLTAPTLRGDLVILEPLDMSHVDGLFAATADPEVYLHLTRPVPASPDEMASQVREALRMYEAGGRIPFVQRSAVTGEIIGSTSYYYPDPVNRSIAIGWTWLGKAWWRTGVNTESKLLLMRHAFDTLHAVRIEWHTDVRNDRSQRAIERLGAVREGILQRHRLRPDGSWRDTVAYALTDLQWPAARDRLLTLLATHAGGHGRNSA
jgi:RimJ/RimL family protein N-acetyltransferase/nitroimidazol reductase NimA-like FMN-containing flavoprotein (pyridoxamine 5'-phosphate oxidase superfamily)